MQQHESTKKMYRLIEQSKELHIITNKQNIDE